MDPDPDVSEDGVVLNWFYWPDALKVGLRPPQKLDQKLPKTKKKKNAL